MISYNESDENKTTIERLNGDDFDDKYNALSERSKSQIFTAFRAQPVLFGDMPDIGMTIHERITKLRKRKNLTQQQHADGIGYGRGQVAKWEKKLADPSIEHVLALADFFGVSCDYLLRGYEKADC